MPYLADKLKKDVFYESAFIFLYVSKYVPVTDQ